MKGGGVEEGCSRPKEQHMQQSRGKRWGIQGSSIWLPDGYSVFMLSMSVSVVVHHACAESASVLHVCGLCIWVICKGTVVHSVSSVSRSTFRLTLCLFLSVY